jgi:hypothetical protein
MHRVRDLMSIQVQVVADEDDTAQFTLQGYDPTADCDRLFGVIARIETRARNAGLQRLRGKVPAGEQRLQMLLTHCGFSLRLPAGANGLVTVERPLSHRARASNSHETASPLGGGMTPMPAIRPEVERPSITRSEDL